MEQIRNPQGGFPGGSVVKNPPANAGNMGSIPGLRWCPGEGNGKPIQYSCLENPVDRGASLSYRESDMTEWLNNSK